MAEFDINKAGILALLEACHSRIEAIQEQDKKRHEMDWEIPSRYENIIQEEIMPAIEAIIYDEPTDDEIYDCMRA